MGVVLTVVGVAVALLLVGVVSSGVLSGAGGGADSAALAAADAKMRARFEGASTAGAGPSAAASAEAQELAANREFVREKMKAAAAEARAKGGSKKRPPRAKVEYTFVLSGAGVGSDLLPRIKAYADEHSLLGHVFIRAGKVEGRFQGREDLVKASKTWLEALDGVSDVDWDDALTHPFKGFEIMQSGH